MDGKTCITCGLCICVDGHAPYCVMKKRYVWASTFCSHWQKEKAPSVTP
jgi:hypothetical protein